MKRWGGKERTNSGGLNHVSDGESLDCLVLGCASGAVGASNRLDVTTTFLVPPAVERQSRSSLANIHLFHFSIFRLRHWAIPRREIVGKELADWAYLEARFLTMVAR